MSALPGRMNKFRNVRVTVDGIKYASKAEARRGAELALMERAKLIKDLERQVWFDLIVNEVKIGAYVADFVYVDLVSGKRVVEDVKSPATAALALYRFKSRLMKALHGIDVKEVA